MIKIMKMLSTLLLLAGLFFTNPYLTTHVLAAEVENPNITLSQPSDSTIPTSTHTHQASVWTVITRATATQDGLEKATCTFCGEGMKRSISHPAKITLSKTKYIYDGNYKRPVVTLYNSNGKIISSTLYNKSYSSNKMPGTAYVKVTLNNSRYNATMKKTFKISLQTVALSSVKAKTEGFRAYWKPVENYISGYIISWATNSSFKDPHYKRIYPRSENHITKMNLKGDTRYYIRIRTYMKKNGKTYRSSWSDVRTVRTRKENCVKLLAVGDNLLHAPVYNSAKTSTGYDFNPMFAHIKEDIKEADLAVINQETILVNSNYSAYPKFGSPLKVADAIYKTGFNVVTHATNHTMDRGVNAIYTTMNYWKKFPSISVLGVHDSQKDANTVKVVTKNGIKIAMLNYTKGTNGIPVPTGKEYLIDLLKDKRNMRQMINKARQLSDFVIVFVHWGKEYIYTPDQTVLQWAQFFADAGVDLVIGTHPHVLQPVRSVTGKNGNKMLCYYSLGNFISAQGKVPRLLGGMADVTIVKDSTGTRIKRFGLIPLVTHMTNGSTPYTTYKLEDYTEALASKNNIHKRTSETFTVKKLKTLYSQIMTQ